MNWCISAGELAAWGSFGTRLNVACINRIQPLTGDWAEGNMTDSGSFALVFLNSGKEELNVTCGKDSYNGACL